MAVFFIPLLIVLVIYLPDVNFNLRRKPWGPQNYIVQKFNVKYRYYYVM